MGWERGKGGGRTEWGGAWGGGDVGYTPAVGLVLMPLLYGRFMLIHAFYDNSETTRKITPLPPQLPPPLPPPLSPRHLFGGHVTF